MTARDQNIAALPVGTCLVHIGPPKTGSTALQAAFDRARPEVLRQGVRYAGQRRHSRSAVMAATGAAPSELWNERSGRRAWDRIVREVRNAREARVFFSSERLAHAEPTAIRTIVDAFGPEGVCVAVTLRPLSRILPAQWQQGVQAGLRTSFDDWLREALAQSHDNAASIWFRHRHDLLVRRWFEVVGLDKVIVIVLDDADRSMLFRTFERLLALEEGTLQAHRDLSNRSLTFPEAEAVRALNHELHGALSPRLHRRVVELGSILEMRRHEPGPDWPPIRLPAWAVDPVGEVAREVVAGIERSGVPVVGNLSALTSDPNTAGSIHDGDPGAIAISPAVVALLDALRAATGESMVGRDSARRPVVADGGPPAPFRRLGRRLGRVARAGARRICHWAQQRG